MEMTDETAWAQATAKGTATALRDSLPALLAAQVTINGVATGHQILSGAIVIPLTIVTGLGEDQRSKTCSVVGGGHTKVDGKAEYFTKPADLGWPSAISDMVRPKTDGDHTL